SDAEARNEDEVLDPGGRAAAQAHQARSAADQGQRVAGDDRAGHEPGGALQLWMKVGHPTDLTFLSEHRRGW
ncbi:MAG: hypothetical protein QOI90_4150, partial [Mycobacterium sp.]|nr:hypothetical protein [Mycobacterium sp.]